MTRRNDQVEVVLAELAAHGISASVRRGGKHMRITWTANGRKRTQVVSTTPSDWNSRVNCRAYTRRALREDGVAK